jgi:hypothetical protein
MDGIVGHPCPGSESVNLWGFFVPVKSSQIFEIGSRILTLAKILTTTRTSRGRKRIDTGPQRAQEGSMPQTIVERTVDNIAESAYQASRATSATADAVEDGVGAVRHAAKQSCDAGEEFLNETTHRLQRHLALTIAMTFAVGATAGALIGWIMKRR